MINETGLTLSGLAAALGVTRAEVAEAIHAGRITADLSGRYDLDQARTAWGKARTDARPPQPIEADPLGFAAARARRELAAAEINELRLARLRGEYIRTVEATAAVGDVISIFRQTLENLPHRAAPQLVGNDLDGIRAILKHEIRQALQACSDSLAAQIVELSTPEDSEFPSIRAG